jgi:DNA-binding NarL/FixJ family response regulator
MCILYKTLALDPDRSKDRIPLPQRQIKIIKLIKIIKMNHDITENTEQSNFNVSVDSDDVLFKLATNSKF